MTIERIEPLFWRLFVGSGKSLLLRRIIELRRRKEPYPSATAVTATTGIAGLNIGGRTIHSFAGIGFGQETKEKYVKNIKKSLKLLMRWRHVETLIIDESKFLCALPGRDHNGYKNPSFNARWRAFR